MLFRYSAATFNGHRIHYDREYARATEGYPGLVVHGPLIASQLLSFIETTAAQIATGKPMKEAQNELEAGMRHLAKLKDAGAVAYTGAPQAIQMLQSGQVPLVPFYGIFINPILDKG
ncbi:MAG: hypothetical protein ACKODB_11350, partial [Betaproteobacteria bacterium]